MADLTLVGDSNWMSPWVFHVLVALEEKRLPYTLELVPLPVPADRRAELLARSPLPKVPMLIHGDLVINESIAISEYLAETFPTPAHPRLFPADLGDRARARQVMSWLRTSLSALRHERPTTTIYGQPVTTPLTAEAAADAEELIRVGTAMIEPGRTTLFDAWCIADADLGLALMRLIANADPVPAPLVAYADAQWQHPSVRKYLARMPTRH